MAIAEGKTRPFAPLSCINAALLETFPHVLGDVIPVSSDGSNCEIIEGDFEKENAPQVIKYETHEFSAVCPFSGLPDIAYLCITYVPKRSVVELKSLKYYLLSYRDVGIYQEHVTQRIFKDLYDLLDPEYMQVITKYNIRGGIDTTCRLTRGDIPVWV